MKVVLCLDRMFPFCDVDNLTLGVVKFHIPLQLHFSNRIRPFWRVTDWSQIADAREMSIAVSSANKRTWKFVFCGSHLYRWETEGVLEHSLRGHLRILGWGYSSCHSAQQTAAGYLENIWPILKFDLWFHSHAFSAVLSHGWPCRKPYRNLKN
jgi:hypothetical protein